MRALRLISISLLVVLAVPSVLADSFGLEDLSNARSSAQLPGLSGVPINDLLLTSNPFVRYSSTARQGSQPSGTEAFAMKYGDMAATAAQMYGQMPNLRSADGNPVASTQFSDEPNVENLLVAELGGDRQADILERGTSTFGGLLAIDSIGQGLRASTGLPPGGEFGGVAPTLIAFSWDGTVFQTNFANLRAPGRPTFRNRSDHPVTPVPEPGTLLLLGSGLLASATILRRKIAGRLSS